MKKFTLLTMAACCLASICQAQIKKGTIFLGGSLAYSKQTTSNSGLSEQDQKSLSLLPSAGIAVKTNLVAGVNLIYQDFKSDNFSSSLAPHSRYYGGGVFLRQYKPLGRNFNLFGESTLDVRGNKTFPYGSTNNMTSMKGWSINAGVYPGLAYTVSRHLQLEAALANLVAISYSETKIFSNTSAGQYVDKQTSFNLNTLFSGFTGASLGFRIFL